MLLRHKLFALMMGVFTLTASADTIMGVEVPDSYVPPEKEEVKEEALVLPKPPSEDQLIPFYVDESFNFTFAIDPASLSFGKDGIMRYTVVMKSYLGAVSVRYEGLRCWQQDAKRYAELKTDSDGQWFTSPEPAWQVLSPGGRNNYRFSLFNRYWCHAPVPMYSVKDMIKSLREGGYESTESIDWPF